MKPFTSLSFVLLLLLAFGCKKDDKPGSIFVTVKSNGSPVRDAQIITNPRTVSVETDFMGVALLSNIEAGTYKVTASRSDIGSATEEVLVKSNNTSNVELNLIRGTFEAPEVQIISPMPWAKIKTGADVIFEGRVRDQQDPSHLLSIEWSSSIDGVLSTAAAEPDGLTRFTKSQLSKGEHIITLKARDMDDFEEELQIRIEVNDFPDSIQLEVVKINPEGIGLQWTAADDPNFESYEIHRRKESEQFKRIARIDDPNLTQYTDRNTEIGESYTYRVIIQLNNGLNTFSNDVVQFFEITGIDVGFFSNITAFLNDPNRPYIYAINKRTNELWFINKIEKKVTKKITMGFVADMDINSGGNLLFIAHQSNFLFSVVDLDQQESIREFVIEGTAGNERHTPDQFVCLEGNRLAYVSRSDSSTIRMINTNSGRLLSSTGNISAPVRMATNAARNRVYIGESNSSDIAVYRYDLFINVNTLVERGSHVSPGQSDPPALVFTDNEEFLFFNRQKIRVDNFAVEVDNFDAPILAASADGSVAVSSTKVYNALDGTVRYDLPVSSEIMLLDNATETLYLYDRQDGKILIFPL